MPAEPQRMLACSPSTRSEHWTHLPVDVELASEFRYRDPIVGPDALVIAIFTIG